MMTRTKFTLIIGFVLIFLSASINRAGRCADNEFTRPSLMNIEEISVLVESLRSEIKKEGLTREIIKSEVESSLRQAGIKVLSNAEGLWVPGKPYLYVNVNVFKSESYIYSITIELHQDVSLIRDPNIKTDASTWSKRYIGISSKLADIRTHTRDMVTIFLNAYHSVNP
ncbi:hypothetical protein ACFL9U_16510 [Thermodesulfobacteriota bacterium]